MSTRPRRPEEVAAALRALLLESSRQQLMSDVPIALFLSGGVDSAVLGSLMQHAGADRITALTIGFEEKSFDESDASQRTADLAGNFAQSDSLARRANGRFARSRVLGDGPAHRGRPQRLLDFTRRRRGRLQSGALRSRRR